MFDVDYLNRIRSEEMERLIRYVPPGARVLEFGAGTGQQARFLADHGFDVIAVDLPQSSYTDHLVFPVQPYDGEHIPLEDRSVDVIFSSNVLEHVENVPGIMSEFRRILRPGGFGVHAMPTSAWRFWTFVAGVPNAAVAVVRIAKQLLKPRGQARALSLKNNLRAIAGGLLPIGHGTSPEGISELYTFSRRAWLKTFAMHGFEVVEDRPIGLFYTGHMLFGDRIAFDKRKALSRAIGSATRIYIVRPLVSA